MVRRSRSSVIIPGNVKKAPSLPCSPPPLEQGSIFERHGLYPALDFLDRQWRLGRDRALDLGERHWRWVVVLVWLGFSAWFIYSRWAGIQAFSLNDTDDNLRMSQVRALLASQDW